MIRTLRIDSPMNFPVIQAAVLTVVIMLYVAPLASIELIYLITGHLYLSLACFT